MALEFRQFVWEPHREWTLKRYITDDLLYELDLYLMPIFPDEESLTSYQLHYLYQVMNKIFRGTQRNKKVCMKVTMNNEETERIFDTLCPENAFATLILGLTYSTIFDGNMKRIHIEVKAV